MATPEPRQIDWDSARIKDATLTVELSGPSSKAWGAQFEHVLVLLDTPHNNWGEVKLTKQAIKVAGVQPGVESELRHFLESIVLQANSDVAPDPPEQDADSEGDPASELDESMTATFRSFASE